MKKIFRSAANRGRFGSDKYPEYFQLKRKSPASPKEVTWDVTYECNLRCKHCVTSSGNKAVDELNTGQAKAVIDILSRSGIRSLLLSGGEPLLRPDILSLIRYMSKSGLKPGIVSNGVDIPVKTLKGLKGNVSNVQVSIDGIGKAHDASRGMDGAFGKACATISYLKNIGVPVSIGMAVTSKNIDSVDAVIGLAIGLGCHELRAIPFLPAGRGKVNEKALRLSKEDSYRLSTFLVGKSEELSGLINVSIDGCFTGILIPPPADVIADGPMGCSAGNESLCISANGIVYPCTYLMELTTGSLLERDLGDIWLNSPVFNELRSLRKSSMSEPCKSCEYAPVRCNGGCRASAYLECGSLAGTDPQCFKGIGGASYG